MSDNAAMVIIALAHFAQQLLQCFGLPLGAVEEKMTKSYKQQLAEQLRTIPEIVSYLQAALDDCDPELLILVASYIIEANSDSTRNSGGA